MKKGRKLRGKKERRGERRKEEENLGEEGKET
jgi:hypothetical protein